MERWRKPVIPLAVSDAENWATAELGRPTLDFKARFTPSDIERFRLGYVCIQCWEPLENAFPENCPLCRYPVKARQAQDFERLYKGEERDPRAATIEKALDDLDVKHEKKFWTPVPGIIVPDYKVR